MMARFTGTSSHVVSQPEQRVEIGGVWRSEVEAVRDINGGNLRPIRMILRLPWRYAGEDLSWLKDASVVVYARTEDDGSWGVPTFVGFVRVETMEEDAANSRVSVEAASVAHLLDRVYVGQRTGQAVVSFPRKNVYSRLPTGWRLTSILQALFSSDGLDVNWRTVLGLGALGGLSSAQFDLAMPDVTFHTATYLQALRQLMGYVPDVGCREVYDRSGKTFLDFFQWGNPGAGSHVLRIPDETHGPVEGAMATAHVTVRDTDNIYSRVIGFGRPIEAMITVGTDHGTAPLLPAWSGATPWTVEDPEEFTDDEKAVLADPDVTRRGAPQFQEDLEFVFRRFRLPEMFRPFTILSRNLYEEEDIIEGVPRASRIGIQVFTQKYGYGTTMNPRELIGTLLENDWKLVTGAVIDTKNQEIILPRPALEMSLISKPGAVEERTWTRVHVYLTMSVTEPRGPRLRWDTGIRGDASYPIIKDTGTVFCFENKSVGFGQIGTYADQLSHRDGTTHTYGARWWDSVERLWMEVAGGTPTIVENDLEPLAAMTERKLMELMRRRVQARVELPYFERAYRPGDGLRILGRGIDGVQLMISAVARSYINPQTVIEASDQVPFVVLTDQEVPTSPRQASPRGLAVPNQFGPFNYDQPTYAGQQGPPAPFGYAAGIIGEEQGPPAPRVFSGDAMADDKINRLIQAVSGGVV